MPNCHTTVVPLYDQRIREACKRKRPLRQAPPFRHLHRHFAESQLLMEPESLAFSIIVPNWNGKPYLARCLSSLLLSAKRTGLSYELIVVDDASTDDSWRIAEERFPRVRLMRNEGNIGFAASVNRGVSVAAGEIAFRASMERIAAAGENAFSPGWCLCDAT